MKLIPCIIKLFDQIHHNHIERIVHYIESNESGKGIACLAQQMILSKSLLSLFCLMIK